MKVIKEVTNNLVIDYRAREWCKLPYPNHPYGCPNYGTKGVCPPLVARIEEYFDLRKSCWLAIVDFNLSNHKRRMKELHPDWSESQLKCVLYWQGTVKKKLKDLCEDFVFENIGENIIYTLCPEAMGLHVFSTMRKLGYRISKNITDIVYKVALIGYPNNEKICS
jgi:predicted metal-binding protein